MSIISMIIIIKKLYSHLQQTLIYYDEYCYSAMYIYLL